MVGERDGENVVRKALRKRCAAPDDAHNHGRLDTIRCSSRHGRPCPAISADPILDGVPKSAPAERTDRVRLAGGIMKRTSLHVSIDRDAVSAFCRRHHITRLALFGSVLRNDFRPDSDVDVLVEFQVGHVPGLKFVSIEREFPGLLHGRRVDMVAPKFLNPRIRDQVLRSAEPLYVAA